MAISSPREANRVPSLVSVSSTDGTTPVNPWTDPITHRLLVDASVTIAANSSVNVNQFGGTNVTLGQKTMSASMPVVLASDQTSIPVAATLSAETTKVIGTVNIAASQTIAVTNAGTFVVQENGAALTSLQLLDDVVVAQGTALGSTKVDLIGGSVTTNAPTFTTGQINQLSLTTAGGLRVDLKDSAANTNNFNVNLAASAATVTVSATNLSTNIAQIGGATVTQGSGTATNALRVELANNGTGNISTVAAVTAITNALPVGTNSIGKISDITTSVVPGTGATNLGKAEDAAHASGDTGVAAWGVRNDNLATTFGNDQDYGPIATDLKGRVQVSQKAATGTLTNVAASASSATVLAANSARIGATVTNDSSSVVYLKFGATASTTSYTVVLAGAASAPFSYYEVPAGYTGIIDGIWASATGNARVTEIT